jgi:hypothetical protein
MAFVKKNLNAILAAGLGVLQFILLALPFMGAKVSFFGSTMKQTVGGYEVMGGEIAYSVFVVLAMVVGILMMLVGIYALVQATVVPTLPGKFGKFDLAKICQIAGFVFAGMSVLMLLVGIIECASNSEANAYASATAYVGIGGWLYTLFAVAGAAAPIVLNRIGFLANKEEAVVLNPICPACGREVTEADAFCPGCGNRLK